MNGDISTQIFDKPINIGKKCGSKNKRWSTKYYNCLIRIQFSLYLFPGAALSLQNTSIHQISHRLDAQAQEKVYLHMKHCSVLNIYQVVFVRLSDKGQPFVSLTQLHVSGYLGLKSTITNLRKWLSWLASRRCASVSWMSQAGFRKSKLWWSPTRSPHRMWLTPLNENNYG